MAGEGPGVVRGEDDAGMDEAEQAWQRGEGDDQLEREVGEYNTDDRGVPHGWVCCPRCFREHLIAECCLCDEVKRKESCQKCITSGIPRQLDRHSLP
jgi:hypothetical protein